MYLLTRVLILFAVLGLVRLLWRLLTTGKASGRAQRSARPKAVTGELKQDPQCGTYVSTEISFKIRIGEQELHFCSPKCQEDFLRARKTVSR